MHGIVKEINYIEIEFYPQTPRVHGQEVLRE